MKKILTIARKEWKNYFTSPVGYIFAALLLIVVNWIYLGDLFLLGQADIGPYLTTMIYLFSIFIPAISMGLLADEKKNSTWEVLLSTPVNEIQLVAGKIIGCGMYLLFTIALSIPAAITVYLLGKPDIGVIISGYLGLILLGSAYLSVGLFMSSLSSQAIVGFLGSAVFLILNNMIGQDVILTRLPVAIKGIVESLSLITRVARINSGLITMSDLMFFGSWIVIFMILTVLTLKTRDK
jgi:ABC-2 type transport system permease protein